MKKKIYRERYYEKDINTSPIKTTEVSKSYKKNYKKEKKKKSDK